MEPTWTKIAQELVVTVVTPLLAAALLWLVKTAVAYYAEKNKATKNEELRKAIDFALTRLDQTAETVVKEANQRIIQRTEAGKVASPEHVQRFAVDAVLNRLPPATMDMLKGQYTENRIREIVVGKVEQKVADAKTVC
jgi:hypothetical protein